MAEGFAITYLPEMVRIFMRKPAEDQFRLLRILLLSFWIRIMVLTLPFRKLAKVLGSQNNQIDQKSTGIDWVYVNTVSRQIRNISRAVPWTSNCLVQAAVGKILLRKRSIDSMVHFGVNKEGRSMKAHAWLTVGDSIVIGGDIADRFVSVTSYS